MSLGFSIIQYSQFHNEIVHVKNFLHNFDQNVLEHFKIL